VGLLNMIVQNHTIDLVLEKRRGFVREAIRANARLVPVIGFGESDLYQVFETDEYSMDRSASEVRQANHGFRDAHFSGTQHFSARLWSHAHEVTCMCGSGCSD
jgi:hypothetical protein